MNMPGLVEFVCSFMFQNEFRHYDDYFSLAATAIGLNWCASPTADGVFTLTNTGTGPSQIFYYGKYNPFICTRVSQ